MWRRLEGLRHIQEDIIPCNERFPWNKDFIGSRDFSHIVSYGNYWFWMQMYGRINEWMNKLINVLYECNMLKQSP